MYMRYPEHRISWVSFLTGSAVIIMVLLIASFLLFETSLTSYIQAVSAPKFDPFLIALIFIAIFASDIFLPIPSSLVSVAAVVLLGPDFGFFTVWAGMTLGCLIGYSVGAGSSVWLTRKFLKPADVKKTLEFSNRYGLSALVLLRAIPVLSETSVLLAGLTRVVFRNFLIVTSLANAGVAAIYAYWIGESAEGSAIYLVFFGSILVPGCAMGIAWLLQSTLSLPFLFSTTKTNSIVPVNVKNRLNAHFEVQADYPVLFTHNVFDCGNVTLKNAIATGKTRENTHVGKMLFVIDQGLADSNPDLQEDLSRYCAHHQMCMAADPVFIPGGEKAKEQTIIDRLYRIMFDCGLDRQSYVVAIGGGGVLDAVGYAATTFHRGVRLVRMPSTVLAQNDAGIGVKNGINSFDTKNLIGCFSTPHAVINDISFLSSLSDRDFRAGIAEAIKVALIKDEEFFSWICSNQINLTLRDESTIAHLIEWCARLHLEQICKGGDPFETGNARPLDYGHWTAHKLESLSGHRLNHGEAVAIGMALDACYAHTCGLLERDDLETLLALLKKLEFQIWDKVFEQVDTENYPLVFAGLEEFRQHLGGELCIPLLTSIGCMIDVNYIDFSKMLLAVNMLNQYAQSDIVAPVNTQEFAAVS
jgi:3-dehydroquinate synthase